VPSICFSSNALLFTVTLCLHTVTLCLHCNTAVHILAQKQCIEKDLHEMQVLRACGGVRAAKVMGRGTSCQGHGEGYELPRSWAILGYWAHRLKMTSCRPGTFFQLRQPVPLLLTLQISNCKLAFIVRCDFQKL